MIRKYILIFLSRNYFGKKIKEFLKIWDYKIKLTLRNILRSKKAPLTILFYPEFPSRYYKITQIFYNFGYNITSNINKPFDLAIFWQDHTYKNPDNKILDIAKRQKVLNINCTDISKEKVEIIFNKIFGYGTFIDPFVFEGKVLQKSNQNAVKDSIIISCPIAEKKSGYIYQKLLSNELRPSVFEEYRALILNKKICYCHFNLIIGDNQFDDHNQLSFCGNYPDFFTSEEIFKINQFCEAFYLDYGELDIIRDQKDGKIYILDVATTPGRNMSKLSSHDDSVKIIENHSGKLLKYLLNLPK